MKYMRNYANETAFDTDKSIMDNINEEGKIWISYIKEPKSITTKYRLRPKYDHNVIEPSTDKLSWEGGNPTFKVYLVEPQSELHLYLPGAYDFFCPDLDLSTIEQDPNNKLNYTITLPDPIGENTYNNKIVYPFYIIGDDNKTVLASCTVTQEGAQYNTTITPSKSITGTVYGIHNGGTDEPLEGARIIVKKITGEHYTTGSTNIEGKFEIEVTTGDALTITVQHADYPPTTLDASTEVELSILLIEN